MLGARDMWDLTVDSDHDFYILSGAPVLVHNCDIEDPTPDNESETHILNRHLEGGSEVDETSGIWKKGTDLDQMIERVKASSRLAPTGWGTTSGWSTQAG